MARLVLLSVFLMAAIIGSGYYLMKSDGIYLTGDHSGHDTDFIETSYTEGEDRYYVPAGSEGQLIHHQYYSLSYNEKYEIPEWVAYILTKKSIQAPNVPRAKKFRPDYDVKTRSAVHKDYSHSGYTRGHMAPAGDMAFSKEAMEQTFYMSNMCPQTADFNAGIWRELEESVRDWAYDNKKLVVVTGPILDGIVERIGKNKVGVPKRFFKVLLDIEEPEVKAIGFLMDHEITGGDLEEFAVSVDKVEQATGLDFFGDLMDDALEKRVESNFNTRLWRFDQKR